MSATTESAGTIKFWSEGLPFQGIKKTGNDTSTIKYWTDGLPEQAIFPPDAATFVFIGRFF